jgi:hypothetical protein
LPLRGEIACAIVVNGEGRGPEETKSVQLASILTVDPLSSEEHHHGDEEKEEVKEGREEEGRLSAFWCG